MLIWVLLVPWQHVVCMSLSFVVLVPERWYRFNIVMVFRLMKNRWAYPLFKKNHMQFS